METISKIRSFILENFLFTDDESELNNNDSFLDRVIIDSTGTLELISFLEEEFFIKVEDAEMLPENLDSVDKVINFLKKKKKISKSNLQ